MKQPVKFSNKLCAKVFVLSSHPVVPDNGKNDKSPKLTQKLEEWKANHKPFSNCYYIFILTPEIHSTRQSDSNQFL